MVAYWQSVCALHSGMTFFQPVRLPLIVSYAFTQRTSVSHCGCGTHLAHVARHARPLGKRSAAPGSHQSSGRSGGP